MTSFAVARQGCATAFGISSISGQANHQQQPAQSLTPIVASIFNGTQLGGVEGHAVRERRARGVQRGPVIRGAVLQDALVPMTSKEAKNISPVDEIKKLRLITAIKTPYLPDGRFDLRAYDHLVNLQLDAGVEGLIVGGTTGEGQLMSWDEHIMLIAHTVNCFGDRLKVIGNTGSNATQEAIHATEQGFAVGMHAALHINPYYGKTSAEGLRMHFRSVLEFGPTVVYNVPARTGQDIPNSIIETLAKDPNFAGVKECTGNKRIHGYASQGLSVWSGNDDEAHDGRWEHGARGVISVTSNLVPDLMYDLMFGGGNIELRDRLLPLMAWLFHEPNPIPLNTALAQLGLIRPIFRLPYVPVSREKRREFVDIVQKIGLEHFKGARQIREMEDDEFHLVARY